MNELNQLAKIWPTKVGDLTQLQKSGIELAQLQERLRPYLAFTDQTTTKGFDRFLTEFLKKSDLRSRDREFETTVKDGDVLEIIDMEGTQIFRNLELFKYTSYSLMDIVGFHWTDLYERPKRIDTKIGEEWMRVMGIDSENAIPLKVPPHVLREKMNERLCVLINFKYAWHLFDSDGNRRAVLISQEAQSIESNQIAFV